MRFFVFASGLLPSIVSAIKISAINGPAFRSPYENQSVTNVTGLVTAIGPSGFFLRDTTPDRNVQSSNSIYVFTSSSTVIKSQVTTGDIITIDGKVSEYRSSKDYLYLTEIISPTNLRKVSSGNAVKPIVLGVDRSPPTYRYSELDDNDVFGVPNNRSLVSVVNATIQQDKYGLDFWESLTGELVSVRVPVALGRPNNYGEVWVRGNYRVTGKNQRGGLTIVPGIGADANPEAISMIFYLMCHFTLLLTVDSYRCPSRRNKKCCYQTRRLSHRHHRCCYLHFWLLLYPTTYRSIRHSQRPASSPSSNNSQI